MTNSIYEQPKIAILQLGEGLDNVMRRFLGFESLRRLLHETPNCSHYELVYVRNMPESTNSEETLNDNLYAEFNARTPRPRNYYGHSLSVGDVIVISNSPHEQHSYYVDNVGFQKLPDDFLSSIMREHICNSFDIRQEYNHLSGNQPFSLSTIDKERLDYIKNEYGPIFRLADIRGAIMDIDEWGYEYLLENQDGKGVWQRKDHTEDSFILGSWDDVIEFVHDVRALCNHPFHELQNAIRSGGTFNQLLNKHGSLTIETAISIHPCQSNTIQSMAAQMIANGANRESLFEECDFEL